MNPYSFTDKEKVLLELIEKSKSIDYKDLHNPYRLVLQGFQRRYDTYQLLWAMFQHICETDTRLVELVAGTRAVNPNHVMFVRVHTIPNPMEGVTSSHVAVVLSNGEIISIKPDDKMDLSTIYRTILNALKWEP